MVYIRNYIKALECELLILHLLEKQYIGVRSSSESLQRVDLCWARDCVHVDRCNVIAGEQDGLDEGI